MSYAAVDPLRESVRANRTEYLAIQLLKQRARATVYADRAATTGNPALANIAALEREILLDAESAWQGILQHWWFETPFNYPSLGAILRHALAKARVIAQVDFDDRNTIQAIDKFLDGVSLDELISLET